MFSAGYLGFARLQGQSPRFPHSLTGCTDPRQWGSAVDLAPNFSANRALVPHCLHRRILRPCLSMIVRLRCADVRVAERFLDLGNIGAGIRCAMAASERPKGRNKSLY